MLNLIRNTDSTIHVPITIDPESSYEITLKSKITCKKITETKQGDMCGTVALFVLNTDADCGQYWLTVNEGEEELYKTTVTVQ